MSSELQRFFVYAPDKTEDGTFEKRLSVRPEHVEMAKKNIAEGVIRVGGFLLTPESIATADAPKKMIGSTFIVEATSIDEVQKLVEGDIYYKAGVWDVERIVILPFVAATTIP
ncbi:hypothetical protein EYR40_006790 [Pleurotus pulmonarius]|nr:hypothetical protein EYR36_011408 [Pleurotus pulmonarius]KAF4598436.1 hypothetical protein EYR38_006838 [Pleurotus pulmonarius]KAF4599691.1 hypothetical protein EYR40_006790 [Pleurotus pulmonarius]